MGLFCAKLLSLMAIGVLLTTVRLQSFAQDTPVAEQSQSKVQEVKTAAPALTTAKAAKMRSGKVVRVSGNNLRLNTSRFKDVAPKQVYLVEGTQPGSIAARIEVLKLSASKKTAIAKVLKFETVTELNALVNLSFYSEKDFLTRQAQAQATNRSQTQSAALNPLFISSLHIGTRRSVATNVVTGADINQNLNTLSGKLLLFIPSSIGTLANKFGLRVNYQTALPSTLIAGVTSGQKDQTITINETLIEPSLVFRSGYSEKNYSRFSVSAGYRLNSNLFKLESSTGAGGTDIKLQQSGPFFGLEADFSPLPFLYLGLSSQVGIPQTYKANDSSNDSSLSGKWNVYDALLFAELRYPVGESQTKLLMLNLSGGLSVHQLDVELSGVSTSKNYYAPEVIVSVGFGAG